MNGGKRPGAGRPPGTKNKKTLEDQEALELFRRMVLEKWTPIFTAKLDLALGVKVEKQTWSNGKKVGDAYVYKEKPDSGSLEYLISLIVGKPKGSVDINLNAQKVEELQNTIKKQLDTK